MPQNLQQFDRYVISPSVIATSRADTFLLAVACCLQPATSPDAFFECQSGAAETRFAGLRCVSSEEGKITTSQP